MRLTLIKHTRLTTERTANEHEKYSDLVASTMQDIGENITVAVV